MSDHWDGNVRKDGVEVMYQAKTDSFVIVDREGRLVLELCPCCDRTMLTPEAARAVADAELPLPSIQ